MVVVELISLYASQTNGTSSPFCALNTSSKIIKHGDIYTQVVLAQALIIVITSFITIAASNGGGMHCLEAGLDLLLRVLQSPGTVLGLGQHRLALL